MCAFRDDAGVDDIENDNREEGQEMQAVDQAAIGFRVWEDSDEVAQNLRFEED